MHGTERVARGGTLYSALLFLHLADLPGVAAALRERLKRHEAALKEIREVRRRIARDAGTGVRYLLDHLAAQRELDRKWLRSILRDIERGNVRDSNLSRLHARLQPWPGRPRTRSRTG